MNLFSNKLNSTGKETTSGKKPTAKMTNSIGHQCMQNLMAWRLMQLGNLAHPEYGFYSSCP